MVRPDRRQKACHLHALRAALGDLETKMRCQHEDLTHRGVDDGGYGATGLAAGEGNVVHLCVGQRPPAEQNLTVIAVWRDDRGGGDAMVPEHALQKGDGMLAPAASSGINLLEGQHIGIARCTKATTRCKSWRRSGPTPPWMFQVITLRIGAALKAELSWHAWRAFALPARRRARERVPLSA